MTDVEIVYQDMQQHGGQAAWDWQADLRFAWAVGAKADVIQDIQTALNSTAPFALRIMAYRQLIHKTITQRRVRALRELVKQGNARASWCGTGPQGVTDFGVNRVRHYDLV